MTGSPDLLSDRALLRELARLGNLLEQLLVAVKDGALCGDPSDAKDVLRMLARIEHGVRAFSGQGAA